MQSFGHLEDGVDHEAILQLFVILNEKVQHHLTELIFDTRWEIVEKTQQIFKTNKLREILGCHHDLNQKILQLHVDSIIMASRKHEFLQLFENLLDKDIHRVCIQILDREINEDDGGLKEKMSII